MHIWRRCYEMGDFLAPSRDSLTPIHTGPVQQVVHLIHCYRVHIMKRNRISSTTIRALQHEEWNRVKIAIHNTRTCCECVQTPIARFTGPTWGTSGTDRTQVGPMLAPWTLLSGNPRPPTQVNDSTITRSVHDEIPRVCILVNSVKFQNIFMGMNCLQLNSWACYRLDARPWIQLSSQKIYRLKDFVNK